MTASSSISSLSSSFFPLCDRWRSCSCSGVGGGAKSNDIKLAWSPLFLSCSMTKVKSGFVCCFRRCSTKKSNTAEFGTYKRQDVKNIILFQARSQATLPTNPNLQLARGVELELSEPRPRSGFIRKITKRHSFGPGFSPRGLENTRSSARFITRK